MTLATMLALLFVFARPPAPAAVRANDNRTPAGTLANGVLTIKLDAAIGSWAPEGSRGPALDFPVFAEQGKAPQIPGPLIRVPAGTEVRATIHNSLAFTLCVRGLQQRSAATIDTFDIEPGATREIRFRATTPGTFYYWGRTTTSRIEGPAQTNEAHLVGALIVDPPGAPARANDRVMVITTFRDSIQLPGKKWGRHELIAMNGMSWPYTERLNYTVGDTVNWRVINATAQPHPMHLHGFYFTVTSRGDRVRDTVFTEQQRRKAVTEYMSPGATMTMSWVPTRPGNWLFHCHLIFHIDQALRLAAEEPSEIDGHATGHAERDMAGLVMGLRVAPARGVMQAGDPMAARKLRMFVDQKPNVFGDRPGYSFVLQDGPTEPVRDSVQFPSSTVVVHRGEPTEITVINRTSGHSSIHWHGIELESFYDGVAGWSGAGSRVAPMLAPGDSFIVRMTPDRAGTFIYHTHSDETVQLSSGLYGALLVLEPGQQRDPNERLFLMGEGGPDLKAVPFVNGTSAPPPIELVVGTTHRFRLINISTAAPKNVRVLMDTALQAWRPFAKDGAELPAVQRTPRPARVVLGPGETMDFEVKRDKPGILTFEIVTGDPVTGQAQRIPVIVR
jgi:FtsP/CotA-like multicopper oxidase with cupredoxin domain